MILGVLVSWWLLLRQPLRRLVGQLRGTPSANTQRLARIEQQLEDLRRTLASSHPSDNGSATALGEALRALEKQIGRAGREQLKINSVAEAQAAQLAAALEQLRAADAQHTAELAALREQGRAAQAAARLEVAQRMFPALDGLDAALRTGQLLLEDLPPPAPPAPAVGGWLQRMFGEPPAPAPTPSAEAGELRQALAAWLHGLTFVRQRLLEALAQEDIWPIDAAGQPFDPQQHSAIGVVPVSAAHPAGVVAEELRRGYRTSARVLRHAEVVVAMEADTSVEF